MDSDLLLQGIEALEKLPRVVELANLAAQLEMVRWTKWSGIGAALAAIFSFLSLLGLLRSLSLTTRALRENRELGETQNRAYVHVSAARHSWTDSGYGLLLYVENVGSTPARAFEVGGRLQKVKLGQVSKSISVERYAMKRWGAVSAKSEPITVRLDTAIHEQVISEFRTPIDGSVVLLVGTVRYQDVYDKWYETDFAFYSYSTETGEINKFNKLRRPTTDSLRAYVPVLRSKITGADLVDNNEMLV